MFQLDFDTVHILWDESAVGSVGWRHFKFANISGDNAHCCVMPKLRSFIKFASFNTLLYWIQLSLVKIKSSLNAVSRTNLRLTPGPAPVPWKRQILLYCKKQSPKILTPVPTSNSKFLSECTPALLRRDRLEHTDDVTAACVSDECYFSSASTLFWVYALNIYYLCFFTSCDVPGQNLARKVGCCLKGFANHSNNIGIRSRRKRNTVIFEHVGYGLRWQIEAVTDPGVLM